MPKIISIIPARGGSKGIAKKNLRLIKGRPLITHTIGHSLNASLVERTYVTTDCEEIAMIAKEAGSKVLMRNKLLASDEASSERALKDALQQIEEQEHYCPDLVVFLQCTSPIRNNNDIDLAIKLLYKRGADSLLSVTRNHKFIWCEDEEWAYPINYDYKNRQRRQDMQPQYCENGSIYIFRPEDFKKHNNRLSGRIALYVMCAESAYEIDSHMDICVTECILNAINSD